MNATDSRSFVDRRQYPAGQHGEERRQFVDSRETLAPDVRELSEAIDAFKLANNRRYITLGEVLDVVKGLGYHK
jgi:hypothetical protein